MCSNGCWPSYRIYGTPLDDDAVFNVVGEVLPAAQVERVLRDFYAGRLGEADLEDRLLRDVDEGRFRDICQTALEGWPPRSSTWKCLLNAVPAPKKHRLVPETIARFMAESARNASFPLKPRYEANPTPLSRAGRRPN